MRKAIVAANWKMNGDRALVQAFSEHNWQFATVDTVFGLPFTLLAGARLAPWPPRTLAPTPAAPTPVKSALAC